MGELTDLNSERARINNRLNELQMKMEEILKEQTHLLDNAKKIDERIKELTEKK